MRPRAVAAALIAISITIAGCAATGPSSPAATAHTPPSTTTGATAGTTSRSTATASTTRPTSTSQPTTTTPATTLPPVPAAVRTPIERALDDPRFSGYTVAASVWIDGLGAVADRNPDLALLPASNEKLLVGIGTYALLDPTSRLATEVRTDGSDVWLVGGGDPFLTTSHLEALARQVQQSLGASASVRDVRADDTRYDALRTAPGWLDWQVPDFSGPISALAVDGNRTADLANPAQTHAESFAALLTAAGVTVTGRAGTGGVPAVSTVIAKHESIPIGDIAARVMMRSDNLGAEVLLKEIGRVALGAPGSTAAGSVAVARLFDQLGVERAGPIADGSGLSRLNGRGSRELRTLLHAARAQPWFDGFASGLPIAGVSGTLARRFVDTPAAGKLRAKSGWILVGRALSGYTETTSGRMVVFSIIVNGPDPGQPIEDAIDAVGVVLSSLP